jgi:hypothetical protein
MTTEHRITFAFFCLSQRRFNAVCKELDAYLMTEAKNLPAETDWEAHCDPGGPADRDSSDVSIQLRGIQADRRARKPS